MLNLLKELSELNVSIWASGDKLKLAFEGENVCSNVVSNIKNNKDNLLRFLHQNKIYDAQDFIELVKVETITKEFSNNIEAIYPATSLQQGFIYHHISQPDDDAYRVQMLFDYQRALDLDNYQEAWRLASIRFPILRTAFDWQGEMLQVTTRGASINKDNFTVKDISHLSLEAREQVIIEIQQEDRAVGFDLTQPGLVRFTIIKQADDLFTVLKSEHHSIIDGWSVPVLMDTVHGYYNQLMAGEAPRIEVDKAYLAAQEYYRHTQADTDMYWSEVKAQYQGANDLSNLLTHKVDLSQVKAVDEPAGQAFKVEGQAYKQLTTMCKAQGVTLNVALQFAWHKLLQTYSGDSQTIVGTTVSGRDVPVEGIESSVGLYINTLPLMVDWEQAELTVGASLKAIQKDIAALNSHSAVSLASLQQDGERLFHSLFVFENYPLSEVDELNTGIESNLAFRDAVEKVDYPLSVIAFEEGDSLTVNLGFSEAWLSIQDATRLLNQLECILSSIAAKPAQLCQSLSFISEDERNTLLHSFNDTEAPYPSDKTLHQLFDEQVSKTPDNIALVFEDKQLTYAELNERANQLAHSIRQTHLDICGHELKADTLIPLYLDRSLEMVISILAVLKAGGAYVPISPEYPAERTQFILTDTDAKMVVTQSQYLETLTALGDDMSLLSADLSSSYESMPTQRPNLVSTANDLAYVIYTSGTTGKPKGVMLAHDAVVNRIYWMQKEYPLAENDRVLQKTPYIFDVSVWELLWANQVGAQIVIAAPVVHKQPELLQALICDAGITTLHFVPSMLSAFSHYLKESSQQFSARINQVFCSGEALGVTQVGEFNQVSEPNTCLFNLYGPTEAAIDVSYFDTRDSFNASVPIGRAIDNIGFYVIDEHLELTPLGVSGELYIGGAGLARGYLNCPDLTAASFIKNPFATDEDIEKGYTRLYKTGDLVRYLADGHLEYLGRNDSQVKIRGYRIELGEIETALSLLDSVKQAVVIDRERDGAKYLAAYVMLTKGHVLDIDSVMASLAQSLPEYMVPATFTDIDAVPLTINGKLDRRALPEPTWVNRDNYTAPRNELETRLCEIWQSVLGLERVGIHDNFFRSGGDSIISIQLVSKLRQAGFSLQVKVIFDAPTVAQLASALEKEASAVEIVAEQGVLEGEFDLLPIQQWFFDGVWASEHHWNQAFMVQLPQGVTLSAIERALESLAEQHDVLRTRFTSSPSRGQRYDARSTMAPLVSCDVSELSDDELHQQLTTWQSDFALDAGPLWQAAELTGYEDGRSRLFFALHHLIIDAVSWRIIADDMRLLLTGQSLPEKTSSYRQWVGAITEYGKKSEKDVAYWQGVTADMRILPELSEPQTQGVMLSHELTETLLREANSGYHTEINDLLLSALTIALQSTFGESVNHIVLEGHGRESIDETLDVSQTVGWFTSMYPVKLDAYETAAETIIHTKEMLRAIPDKGLGYGALRQVGRVAGQLPEVSFNYLGQLGESSVSGAELDWSLVSTDVGVQVSFDNEDDLALNINGAVQQGVLGFSIISRLSQGQTALFVADFEAALTMVINTAKQQAQLGGLKTPSDYGLDKFSVSELYRLQGQYDIEAIYPATSLQQGFIYHHISQPDDDAYRVQMLFDYQRALDLDNYQEAWRLASIRFPILRTAFDWQGEMLQVTTRGASINKDNFTVKDISHLSLEAREQVIIEIQQEDRAVGFDLTQPGLVRFTIIKQADDLFTVLKSEHHSIIDGWSVPVLMDTVHGYYNQLMAGEAPRIEVDKAYLAAQEYYRHTQADTDMYWSEVKAQYQGANDLSNLLTHKVDLSQVKAVDEPAGQAFKVEGQAYKQLTTMCKAQGVTLNVALQFAWHKLLQTYSGDSQTIVGTTVSGRDVPVEGIESSVGLYINTLPLMVDWEQAELTVGASLKAIQKDIAALNSHSAVSLASLQQDGERLFHSLFVFENYPLSEVDELNTGIESNLAFRDAVEKVDYPLSVIAFEEGDSLTVNLGFSEAWLSIQDATRLLNQLECILSSIAAKPAQLCQSLSFISEDERNTLLHSFNDTEAPYPSDKTLHQLFDEQVSKTPDNIALVFEDKQLTYAELNERANQLAHSIRQTHLDICGHELKADTLIPLYLDRSLEMVISILAVLKAGGAYVPISPEYPAERTQFILTDTDAKMVVTQSQYLETLTALGDDMSLLSADLSSSYESMPTQRLNLVSTANDLAYVIYTSGTTGKPKGVLTPHQGITSLVQNNAYVDLSADDVFLQLSDASFDAATFELWGALTYGAKLVLPTRNAHISVEQIRHLLSSHKISVLWLTRALFDSLYVQDMELFANLRYLLVGGEALTPDLIRQLLAQESRPEKVLNGYGPTESTTFTTTYDCDHFGGSVPIGKPINTRKVYVLDSDRKLSPLGVSGELYIGGAGLARGYLNCPDLTAASFIKNPFATAEDIEKGYTRLYKTGDLVRYLADGHLEYLGRNDSQVKIRGYRIELGEIETALSLLDSVKQAVVIDRERDGAKYLAAYVMLTKGHVLDIDSVMASLAQSLPEYMVPATFTDIDAVPLTINGKLDRRALPEPTWVNRDNYTAPRNELETRLCEIWQSVLGLERVGIHDNFFRSGGDSIISIQLVSKLRQAGFSLQVKVIFDAPTVAQLASALEKEASAVEIVAEQGVLEGEFDLLPIQQWFFDGVWASEHHWNQAFMVQLPQGVTLSAIERALESLAEQHDVLRTRFTSSPSRGQRYDARSTMAPLVSCDVSELSDDELHQQLTTWQSDFALDAGPLWQAAELTGYEDGRSRLFFALHHLIIDAVSWRIIADDMRLLLTGQSLPEKTSSYRQWVGAITEYGKKSEKDVAYWQGVTADMRILPELSEPQTQGVMLSHELTETLLREANSGYHTEINDLLLSALTIALQSTFGESVNHIVLEGHGRESIDETLDVSQTVGWFTSMYPVKLDAYETAAETIIHTKEMLRAIPDKGLGYGALRQVGRVAGQLPEVSFNYLGQLGESSVSGAELDWSLVSTDVGVQVSFDNEDDLALNINGAVQQGVLGFSIISRLSQGQTALFVADFEAALTMVINTAKQQAQLGGLKTPSDYGLDKFSVSELYRLQGQYDIEAIYPATSLQQGFIYHHISQPDDDAYRVQMLFDYQRALDLDNYQEAWRLASIRFPILRTAFDWQGEMLQVTTRGASINKDNFTVKDISHLSLEAREQVIIEIQQEDRAVGFDLTQPGLVRFTIIKQADDLFTVLKSEHHSIIDGWSVPVLMDTVHGYYNQLMAGEAPRIEVDKAYLAAQEYYRHTQADTDMYWSEVKAQYQGANDLSNLLTHKVDLSQVKAVDEPAGQAFKVEGQAYKQLTTMCKAQGVTLNVALQFAWHKLLQTYSGDSQTIVGTTVSGRDVPVEGIESSVGLYINTLPLMVDWEQAELTVGASLKAIQKDIAALNSHSAVSLASLQQDGERLFHSLFVFENYPLSEVDELNTGIESNLAFRDAVEKVDYPLSVIAFEEGDSLTVNLGFSEAWLSIQDATRLLNQLECILSSIAAKPAQLCQSLSFISEDERNTLLHSFNDTEAPYPSDKTLHQLFDEQVSKTPDNIALVFEDKQLTYAELNERANQLAHSIRQTHLDICGHELKADTLIPLYLDRSLEMVISILAVLKAGGAYVPISPEYPAERTQFILTDTDAKMVVTQSQYLETLTALGDDMSLLSADLSSSYESMPTQRPNLVSTANDLAYVIYTSGTTGKPKGVMLAHDAVVNRIYWMQKEYPLAENDRVLQKTPYIFDVSVWELLWANQVGAQIVIAAPVVHKQPELLQALICDAGITTLHFVPSMLSAFSHYLKESSQQFSARINQVFCSGEALGVTQVGEFNQVSEPNTCLFNLYGPTEAAIDVSYFDTRDSFNASVPIGRAIDNIGFYVIDEHLELTPLGVSGELYIGGAGLARGYLNCPDLTAASFIKNPFATAEDIEKGYTRLYKTGDLVRYLADGHLEYLGRNDSQVKIRGYRIELGEIETALSLLDSVKQAVVIDRERDGAKYLAAYVMLTKGHVLDIDSVMASLAQSLPEYMVPATFTDIDAVPLTINGKLDRRALPEPTWVNRDNYTAPRNELETRLCEIWQSVLGLERVGIHDNFFRSGGDSIISIQLVSKLRQAGFSLQVKVIFDAPTVAQLASALEKEASAVEIVAEQGVLEGEFDLLPIQQWFFDGVWASEHHWNQAFMVQLPQGVTLSAIERALESLAEQHDVLRTRFTSSPSRGQRYDARSTMAPLVSCDVSELSDDELHQQLTTWQSDFALDAGPLWQAAELTGYEDGRSRLFFALHHLIIDAVSWRIIADDMRLLLTGQSLPEKTSSYRQWVGAITEYGKKSEKDVAYWQGVTADMRILPELSEPQTQGVMLSHELTETLLREANSGYHTEINDLLLSALTIALQSTFGESVNHIVLEGHGRESIDETLDVSQTVGWFTSMYPVKLDAYETAAETIIHTKEMLRAIPDKGLGYGALRQVGRVAGQLPEVSFNYLGQLGESSVSGAELDWSLVSTDVGVQVSFDNEDDLALNINGAVQQGVLGFSIISRLSQGQTALFVADFEAALTMVINTAKQQAQLGGLKTPSDYGLDKFSVSELYRLQGQYDIEAIYPATSLQQGFIYHHISQPDDDAYRVQMLFDYQRALDLDNYQEAWRLASIRFPILRTAFDWQGEMLQVTTRGASINKDNFTVKDISHLSLEAREQVIIEIQQEDRAVGFDLTQPGLVRFTIIKQADDLFTVLKSEHHSIIDGWSVPVLMDTVHGYYNQLMAGEAPRIEVDKAYLAAQEYYRHTQADTDMYWSEVKAQYQGANDLSNLLTHKVDLSQVKAVDEPAGQAFKVEGQAYKQLTTMCKAQGVTLNVALQFAWHKLLQTYSGDSQTIVGTTVSGRDVPVEGIESSVGLYINTLPLMVDWEQAELTVGASLKAIQKDIAALNSHSAVSLASLQQDGERLFHSLFVFENYPLSEVDELNTGIESNLAFRDAVEKVDYPLSVIAFEEGDSLTVNLGFSEAWLSIQDATRLLNQLECILSSIAAKPAQLCQSLSFISEDERNTLLHSFNDTEAPYPSDKTLHQLFDEQVSKTPDNIALVFEDKQLTYAELNERANQLAHSIRQTHLDICGHELKADTLIPLYLDRSLEMVISILAVLKAGGAYVPISPEYPAERTQFILTDTDAKMVVTQSQYLETLTALGDDMSLLSADLSSSYESMPTQRPNLVSTANDLAYVIYTSGTTGKPKGVMIEHRGVVNLSQFIIKTHEISADTKVLLFSNYVFDASVYELFPCLFSGASLHIVLKHAQKNPEILLKMINEYQIDKAFIPTVIVNHMAKELKDSSLQVLHTGGDVLNALACLPAKVTFNQYGPTEGTVCVTQNLLKDFNDIQIGKAIDNTLLYVLNTSLQPVALGGAGELYIGGAGLARGYLNRPDLTAASFIKNPFATAEDIEKGYTRLYKTGDLVRYLADGHLEYLGRNDSQVKIRGYRIELGEIETALSLLDSVKQAVVIDRERDGAKYLAAYVMLTKGHVLDIDSVMASLAQSLPEYMVPATFTDIDAVPLTINGKLDRRALPEPTWVNRDNYTAPRNELETRLCEIWQSVLGLERVGIHDNFFRSGGDSIISIQLVSKLRQAGFSLQVKVIFDAPTVAQLASALEKEASAVEIVAEQGVLEGEFDLLPIQQWFFDGVWASEHHWNQAFMVQLPQGVTLSAIERALESLAEQHDVLRTRFTSSPSRGQRYDARSAMAPLVSCDVSELSDDELHQQLTTWQSDFALDAGPLWQAAELTGYEDGRSRLFFALHHLIIDAVSWRIIADDMRLLLTGQSLPEKTSSYRQWVGAITEYGKKSEKDVAYWQGVTADMRILPELSEPQTQGVMLSHELTETLLREANSGYHTEINDLLLSALTIALQSTFGESVNHIVLEGHGRESIDETLDVSQTVGWFTSMYPVKLDAYETAAETIIHTKEMLRAIPDKGLGYGALRQVGRVAGQLPEVSFNYLGQLGESSVSGAELDWSLVSTDVGVQVSFDNEDDLALNINGAVQQGVLGFSIISRLSQGQTALFVADFEAALTMVINTAKQQAQLGGLKTPSDYGLDKFSVSELYRLQGQYDIEAIYPATSLQQGFIYHHISQPDDDAYRVQMLFDYQRALDLDNYQEAWRLASIRFPILRTAFDWQGEMLQVTTRGASINKDNFTVKDISHLSLEAREQVIIEIQQEDRAVGFDLTQPGLVRFTIIKQADDLFTVLKSEHHSIIDGWSVPVLMDTVHGYYNQLMAGEAPRIEVDKAYLAAQEYYRHTQADTDMYWSEVKAQYQGANDLSNLLTHKVDLSQVKAVDEPAGQAFKVEGQAYKQLTTMCKAQGVTLNVALQFAWHKLLQTYSGDSQTIVGTTVSGRDVPVEGIESSVGLYINTLPLMVDWEQAELTVGASLKAIQKDIAALNSHSAVSLASLQQDGERLFHSLFVFENYPLSEVDELNTGIESNLAFRDAVEKVDYPLSVIAFEEGDSLTVNLGFSEAWLSIQDATRLLNQLECILSSIAAKPAQLCQSLSFISEDERNTLLHSFNDTEAPYPSDKTLHQLFDEQVSKTPDNIALVFEDKQLTYAELNERANQLAHSIRQTHLDICGHELKADTLIPLYLDRSLEMVISILAVLKAGGAYVPISPEYPAERTQFILTDTDAKMVVTQSQYLETLTALGDDMSLLSADLSSSYESMPTQRLNLVSTANDLAYVIYTSGTTGKPKGVMIEHRGVVNLSQFIIKTHEISADTKVLLFSNYVFDASVYELFPCLFSGASLHIVLKHAQKNPEILLKMINEYQIDKAFIPTVIVNHMAKELKDSSLQVLHTGGDVLNALACLPAKVTFNQYGPTEGTVCVTQNLLKDFNDIQIGKAIDNTLLYVLNTSLQPVALGGAGELYIGGAGLARGYLNRPDLTAASFIKNPFATAEDIEKGYTRLYKTGDLVRYLADGHLEYLGRNDSQVKIRGYRIELGEIETALSLLDSVKQAVVIDRERDGAKYLAAYVMLTKGHVLDIDSVMASLAQSLPEYMVPATFTDIDAVPLTINGKLDRRALPEPTWVNRDNYTAPRNELETRLCEIWQSVLGLERVGIHDNFFRSGGDSISAIKLVAAIRRELSIEIVLSVFFSQPQIASFSNWLERERCLDDLLKMLTPESCARQKLFMIHPSKAGSEVYAPLAAVLADEFNCIGIDNYNHVSDHRISSLREMGKIYLDLMLTKTALDQPIYILGWSLGGQVAMEVAYQLELRGAKNIKLYLLDSLMNTAEIKSLREQQNLSIILKSMAEDLLQSGVEQSYIDKVVGAFSYEHIMGQGDPSGKLEYAEVTLFKAGKIESSVQNDNIGRQFDYFLSELTDNNISCWAEKPVAVKLFNERCHDDIVQAVVSIRLGIIESLNIEVSVLNV